MLLMGMLNLQGNLIKFFLSFAPSSNQATALSFACQLITGAVLH
jgi:hypothetical protein